MLQRKKPLPVALPVALPGMSPVELPVTALGVIGGQGDW